MTVTFSTSKAVRGRLERKAEATGLSVSRWCAKAVEAQLNGRETTAKLIGSPAEEAMKANLRLAQEHLLSLAADRPRKASKEAVQRQVAGGVAAVVGHLLGEFLTIVDEEFSPGSDLILHAMIGSLNALLWANRSERNSTLVRDVGRQDTLAWLKESPIHPLPKDVKSLLVACKSATGRPRTSPVEIMMSGEDVKGLADSILERIAGWQLADRQVAAELHRIGDQLRMRETRLQNASLLVATLMSLLGTALGDKYRASEIAEALWPTDDEDT